MAIIHMTSNSSETFPEGANCPLYWNMDPEHKSPVVVYETHHGLCLQERERNMYDDSDFFMSYWDEESQSVKEVMFATTRGWSYPCYGSSVDATDEVKEKAAVYYAEQQRRAKILAKWRERQEVRSYAKAWGMTTAEAKRVLQAYPVPSYLGNSYRSASNDIHWAIDKLLRTKSFRSNFRKNITQQIRTWAKEESPKYPTPLSKKQVRYI
ncbi:MAG: hypothetical protein ACWGQW_15090 [bacterium]